MRPRTTPLGAYDEIRSVAQLRLQIPTDKDLAERWRISVGYVRQLMHLERQRLSKELEVSIQRSAVVVSSRSEPAVPRNAHVVGPQDPELEALADEVREMHLQRETLCQTIPLEPRPFQPRPRPQTAIIGEHANEIISTREIISGEKP